MKKSSAAIGILVVLASLFALFPFLFVVSNSFMSTEEITARYSKEVTEENRRGLHSGTIHFVELSFIPEQFSLKQYKAFFFEHREYLRYIWNSICIVVPVLVGQYLIAPLGAFGFENLRFKYKEPLFFLYLIVMLMPMQLLMVPNFIVAGWLNIRDSYLAVILPALFHPMGVFLIRQQLKAFPKEVTEAACLDGAGEFTIFLKIIKPAITSAVAALVILLFSDNWNMVDQAVVFIQEPSRMPMSVMLNEIASLTPQVFFAASCVFLVPAVILFLLGQDYLVKGIQLSSIKL